MYWQVENLATSFGWIPCCPLVIQSQIEVSRRNSVQKADVDLTGSNFWRETVEPHRLSSLDHGDGIDHSCFMYGRTATTSAMLHGFLAPPIFLRRWVLTQTSPCLCAKLFREMEPIPSQTRASIVGIRIHIRYLISSSLLYS